MLLELLDNLTQRSHQKEFTDFIHGIVEINKKIGTDSHTNDMRIIKKMGFNVCEHNKTVETFNDAINIMRI